MKKRNVFLTLLFAVALISGGYAQSFKFGPKVGLNVSNYTGDNVESDALVGMHLGGLLSFGIGKCLLHSTGGAFFCPGSKDQE